MAISLSAYARHRKAAGLTGGTTKAVTDARDDGRLPAKCFDDDGKIIDAALADAEWLANTKADYVPLTGPTSAGEPPPDLNESRARKEAALAALAEIELAEKLGELVPAYDVERRLVSVFSGCKTKLLGIPSRARQRDPSLTVQQVAMIERLIREALTELSGGVR